MFSKFTSIGSVLVLPALIRMHNQSIHRGKAFKRLMEHILNLLHIRAERKIIRDNFIGIHVKDWRKVALSPGERKLRHIGCPFLQGSVCAEVPVDDIGDYLAHFTPIRVVFLLGTFSGQPQPIQYAEPAYDSPGSHAVQVPDILVLRRTFLYFLGRYSRF